MDEPPVWNVPPGPEGPFEPAPQGNPPFGANLKYSSTQPRVSAGNEDGGQWTAGGGGTPSSGSTGSENSQSRSGSDNRVLSDANQDDEWKPGTQLAQARGGSSGRTRAGAPHVDMTPAQAARYTTASNRAVLAIRRVQERDPKWRPTPSLTETAEGAIRAREAEAAEAEARFAELLRDAVPNTNPDWGGTRLRKELGERGFVLDRPSKRPTGYILRNPDTGEEVRIMQRPGSARRSDPAQKHLSSQYYRYRPGKGQREGTHILIPDKE